MMGIITPRFKPLLFVVLLSTLTGLLVTAAPTIPFPLEPRLVVAHFMVGNTYPYTYDDWARDIILASTKSIDAFALNIGADPWEPARVADAFYIASALMKDAVVNDTSVSSTSSFSLPSSTHVSSTTKTSSALHASPALNTSSMYTYPATTTALTTGTPTACAKKNRKRVVTATPTVLPRAEQVPPWAYPYGMNHTPFSLFLSFDMSSLPCSSLSDAEQLRNYLRLYQSHPRYLKYQDKMLVSTFSGEGCRFGQGSVEEGWRKALDFELRDKIHFVPAFFVNQGSELGRWRDVVNGDFHWNGAWPMGNYSIEAYPDYEHLRYNNGKTYMAGVSPWFFTHYGPNTYNKNWIYRSDDWLPVKRWELIVQNRAYVDIAQLISWNDYGESHYIGPVHGAQPMSQSWVDGFDHTSWLDMMRYYIEAYKTGAFPEITKDQFFLWGRLYPRDAVATDDSVGKPAHAEWTEDYLWGLVFLTSPAHVSVSCGSSNLSVDLPAGVNKIKLNLTPERLANLGKFDSCQVYTVIQKNGRDVVNFLPPGFVWRNGNVQRYNFNAFVAGSA